MGGLWRKVRALSLGGMWGVVSTLVSGVAYTLGQLVFSGAVSWPSVANRGLGCADGRGFPAHHRAPGGLLERGD